MMSPNHAGIRDSELRRKDAARATWRGNVEKTGEKTARKKTQQCGGYEKQRDENRYRGETEKRIGQTDSRNAKVLYVVCQQFAFKEQNSVQKKKRASTGERNCDPITEPMFFLVELKAPAGSKQKRCGLVKARGYWCRWGDRGSHESRTGGLWTQPCKPRSRSR